MELVKLLINDLRHIYVLNGYSDRSYRFRLLEVQRRLLKDVHPSVSELLYTSEEMSLEIAARQKPELPLRIRSIFRLDEISTENYIALCVEFLLDMHREFSRGKPTHEEQVLSLVSVLLAAEDRFDRSIITHQFTPEELIIHGIEREKINNQTLSGWLGSFL